MALPLPTSPSLPSPPARGTRAADWRRSAYELLASMRFAIALLTVLSIASVIGTVLRQHEPLVNYVDAFGPFWAQLFLALQLHAVYGAWWFVLILAFLVLSTSLCIARHAPKYLADMRRFQANVRIGSLRAMPMHAPALLPGAPAALAQALAGQLANAGWRVRTQQRSAVAPAGQHTGHPSGHRAEQPAGWMVVAKKGAAHKLGYIATHSAIVLVCLGGLVDGNLFIRAQTWWGGKTPFTGSGLLADIGAQHRLAPGNPAFRGHLRVAEGSRAGTAIVPLGDGILLQELPFLIELLRFDVEYYSTGMPRVFASDVVVHDRATGTRSTHRIAVNHPLRVHGVDIFQSSFEDGGSQVRLLPIGLHTRLQAQALEGQIGGAALPTPALPLPAGTTLELAELRVLNVENLSDAARASAGVGVDVRKVDLRSSLQAHLGAGNKTTRPQDLRNVGPSITYRLRDGAGQATEFHNYMLAVDLGDGVPVYLLGMRRQLADAFSYLRVPQDGEGSMDDFLRLQRSLGDAAARQRAVAGYVAQVVDAARPDLQAQLASSAARTLALFAGESPDSASASASQRDGAPPAAGLLALSQFLQTNVPAAELEQATEVVLRIVNGVLFELLQQARQADGLTPLDPAQAQAQDFLRVALFSLSDAHHYPVDVAFMLDDFTQVQASVFQVAKAPGRPIVYLGCFLLIAGVFMMLFVRDRRLWIWLQADVNAADTADTTSTQALLAMATNRKTLDAEGEFAQLQHTLLGEGAAPPKAPAEPPAPPPTDASRGAAP